MSFFEIFGFALRGVAANKLRSGLTVLGILIGVAAVILLVAVGTGSAKQVEDSLAALGTNTLTVQGGRGGDTGYRTDLTLDIVKALQDKESAPDVKSVSPVVNSAQTLTFGDASYDVNSVIGTYPSYFSASNSVVASGSGFTEEDVDQAARVVVLGPTTAEELFGTTVDPVGQRIGIAGQIYSVIGVLAKKGSTGFNDPDDVAIAPLPAVQRSLTGYGPVSSITIEAASADAVAAAKAEITAILNAKMHVADGASSTPYQIRDASQLLETRTATAETFTVLLGAVAGISLVVGGIGITNIMMVSVTERTREIGIRKALGAPRRVILSQFLIEATLLSLLGGGLGVAAALIGANFEIVGIKPVIMPDSVVLALGVCVAIGLFFGSYPASRAAGLRPIDALRYE
ncbi:ABC transporter permease [Catellatospora chokoriensis]|uniref:Peptide ABC transporter permease n=1 Tax=Catellatospora chokoriensis TaxID=310353 RepID=A0A8J3K5D6_9ACTN|nr:ABC transporter permease [Catellatospora chokoriensis]GIF88779.1 peptide ABC transporter permease [Catellatospora chokoriensis]